MTTLALSSVVAKAAVIFFSLFVLATTACLAYNPKEQAKQKKDKFTQEGAKEIVDSLDGFYKKYSCYPWDYNGSSCAKKLTSQNQATVSSLAPVLEKLTEEPGGLSSGTLKADFLNQVYLFSASESVNLCFTPESKKYKAMANRTKDGQTYCRHGCFVCVSKYCHLQTVIPGLTRNLYRY